MEERWWQSRGRGEKAVGREEPSGRAGGERNGRVSVCSKLRLSLSQRTKSAAGGVLGNLCFCPPGSPSLSAKLLGVRRWAREPHGWFLRRKDLMGR